MGANYVTPIKYYKPIPDIGFKVCNKHKRLQEIFDKKTDFQKEIIPASLSNIGQSYKSTAGKMFTEAISIDQFLEIKADSMDDVLKHFNLLKYKYILHRRNDYQEYDNGFELTEDDYRNMYRDAFDGNSELEWNID